MIWIDTTDPIDSWTGVSDPPHRHTYGAEYGRTTRVVFGDNVRYGGSGFDDVTDPSDTWSDVTDPSDN